MESIPLRIFSEIMQDPTLLSLEEKILMCYIHNWERQGKCCFVSEDKLTTILGTNVQKINALLQDLRNRNRISIRSAAGYNAKIIGIIKPGEINQCTDSEYDIFEL